MTAPLSHVLVQRPHAAFGRAYEDPAAGFRHPVDLARARLEHDAFTALLGSLGAHVHPLGADEHPSPDLVYAYDPALVTARGAILLRSGKQGRRGEEVAMAGWFSAHGVPIAGRIEEPGTVDGGDVFWLRPDLVCVGRSLRTNRAGILQLTELLDGEVHVFDVPYDAGPDECLHLLSVISPVADDLAVVELARLPAGLYELLVELRGDAGACAPRGGRLARLQRARRPSRRRGDAGGQSADRGEAGGGRVRGAHLRRGGDLPQRFGRAYLPDPAGAQGGGVSPPAPADRGRIAEELAALVAIPSITGDEEAVQTEVARRMEAGGLGVRRIDADPEQLADDPAFPGYEVPHPALPIVAGHLAGREPGPRILLSGHVDVVPPGDPSDWTTPAFEPVVRGGALHGRGACDMKGGLVAALEAARLVAGSGVELAGELVVLAVPAEEDGGAGSLAAIRAGYTGAACVITEPTRLEVVVAHAGAITFTLDVPGRAAHASMRREGVSALDKLGWLLEALAADERRRNEAETDPLMTAIGLPYPTIAHLSAEMAKPFRKAVLFWRQLMNTSVGGIEAIDRRRASAAP
jgi:N-dimethylarginine dimethylaminohydrolase